MSCQKMVKDPVTMMSMQVLLRIEGFHEVVKLKVFCKVTSFKNVSKFPI
jgi:hypothetical protein